MTKRKQGCYCKVCGSYKSNESFSGKGHAAHICKSCSRLPETEKAWLIRENRKPIPLFRHERDALNKIKSQLIINRLIFEVKTSVWDEYGDSRFVDQRFEIDRVSGLLYLHENGEKSQKRMRNATKSLRWLVHSLDVFTWPQHDESIIVEEDDIAAIITPAAEQTENTPLRSFDSEDGLATFADIGEHALDDRSAGKNRAWSMRIEYSRHWVQAFWGNDELPYPALEFYEHLMEYFEPEEDEQELDNPQENKFDGA